MGRPALAAPFSSMDRFQRKLSIHGVSDAAQQKWKRFRSCALGPGFHVGLLPLGATSAIWIRRVGKAIGQCGAGAGGWQSKAVDREEGV